MPRKPGYPSLGWKMGKELMVKAQQLLPESPHLKMLETLALIRVGIGLCLALRLAALELWWWAWGGFNQVEHSYGDLGR